MVKLVKRFWKKPAYGAIAPTWLATSEEVEGINGKYYNEKELMGYIEYVENEELQRELRILTEGILSS